MPLGSATERFTLTIKQRNEQAAFIRFAERLGQRMNWYEVVSCPEPEPDLLCAHDQLGPIAFELVSLTDPEVAKRQAVGSHAYSTAFSTCDPSERIIRNKLHKSYATTASHIELLIYTDGQIITPDDVIISYIQPWFDAIDHQFQRIWFMGEKKTSCLWTVV